MTLVCKPHGSRNNIFNHIYKGGDKMTPDINPLYVGIEWSFPDDSKNVSFVDMGLVKAVL